MSKFIGGNVQDDEIASKFDEILTEEEMSKTDWVNYCVRRTVETTTPKFDQASNEAAGDSISLHERFDDVDASLAKIKHEIEMVRGHGSNEPEDYIEGPQPLTRDYDPEMAVPDLRTDMPDEAWIRSTTATGSDWVLTKDALIEIARHRDPLNPQHMNSEVRPTGYKLELAMGVWMYLNSGIHEGVPKQITDIVTEELGYVPESAPSRSEVIGMDGLVRLPSKVHRKNNLWIVTHDEDALQKAKADVLSELRDRLRTEERISPKVRLSEESDDADRIALTLANWLVSQTDVAREDIDTEVESAHKWYMEWLRGDVIREANEWVDTVEFAIESPDEFVRDSGVELVSPDRTASGLPPLWHSALTSDRQEEWPVSPDEADDLFAKAEDAIADAQRNYQIEMEHGRALRERRKRRLNRASRFLHDDDSELIGLRMVGLRTLDIMLESAKNPESTQDILDLGQTPNPLMALGFVDCGFAESVVDASRTTLSSDDVPAGLKSALESLFAQRAEIVFSEVVDDWVEDNEGVIAEFEEAIDAVEDGESFEDEEAVIGLLEEVDPAPRNPYSRSEPPILRDIQQRYMEAVDQFDEMSDKPALFYLGRKWKNVFP